MLTCFFSLFISNMWTAAANNNNNNKKCALNTSSAEIRMCLLGSRISFGISMKKITKKTIFCVAKLVLFAAILSSYVFGFFFQFLSFTSKVKWLNETRSRTFFHHHIRPFNTRFIIAIFWAEMIHHHCKMKLLVQKFCVWNRNKILIIDRDQIKLLSKAWARYLQHFPLSSLTTKNVCFFV